MHERIKATNKRNKVRKRKQCIIEDFHNLRRK